MSYNGHKNWNAWNVALWIGNDEHLYRQARARKRIYGAKKGAEAFLEELNYQGITETPDGAPYNKTNIMLAMRGI